MTAAQRRVLDALSDIERSTGGWPVTVRAICDRLGIASPSTVHWHLKELVRSGAAEKSPYASGGYRIKAAT